MSANGLDDDYAPRAVDPADFVMSEGPGGAALPGGGDLSGALAAASAPFAPMPDFSWRPADLDANQPVLPESYGLGAEELRAIRRRGDAGLALAALHDDFGAMLQAVHGLPAEEAQRKGQMLRDMATAMQYGEHWRDLEERRQRALKGVSPEDAAEAERLRREQGVYGRFALELVAKSKDWTLEDQRWARAFAAQSSDALVGYVSRHPLAGAAMRRMPAALATDQALAQVDELAAREEHGALYNLGRSLWTVGGGQMAAIAPGAMQMVYEAAAALHRRDYERTLADPAIDDETKEKARRLYAARQPQREREAAYWRDFASASPVNPVPYQGDFWTPMGVLNATAATLPLMSTMLIGGPTGAVVSGTGRAMAGRAITHSAARAARLMRAGGDIARTAKWMGLAEIGASAATGNYRDLRESGVGVGEAFVLASLGAAAEVVLENYGVETIAGYVMKNKSMLGRLSGFGLVKEAARDSAVMLAKEGATEWSQSIATAALRAAGLWTTGKSGQEIWEDFWENGVAGGLREGVAVLPLALMGVGARAARVHSLRAYNEEMRERLEAAGVQLKELAADGPRGQQAAAALAEAHGGIDVSFPARDLAALYQENMGAGDAKVDQGLLGLGAAAEGTAMERDLRALGLDPDAVRAAAEAGGEVRVPAAVWAQLAQGTELGAALWGRGNVRLGADAATENEIKAQAAAIKNDVAKIAAAKGMPEEIMQGELMKKAQELAAQSGTMSQADVKNLAQVTFALAQALGRHVKDVDGLQWLNRVTVESERPATPGRAPARPLPADTGKTLDAVADAAAARGVQRTGRYDGPLASEIDRANKKLMDEVPWGDVRPEMAEAEAGPAPETAPASTPDMAVGKAGVLVLADGARMEFDYVAMDLGGLSFSHDLITLNPNPDYKGVQERAREGFDSRIFAEQTIVPELVIGESATAESGPPVADPEGTVHGGFMRGALIARSYAKGDGLYAKHLAAHAADFGVDPAALARMERPVLVRRLRLPVADPAQFSVMLNRSMTMGKNLMETAVSRGAFVGANVLEVMADAGENETTAAFLDRRGADLAQAMIKDGAFDKAEVGEYLDADGKLTAEGRLAAEYMMLGHLVPSRKALTSLTPAARNKIVATAAAFIRTRGNPDYDLSRLVAGVAAHLVQKAGKSWEEYGPGASLFGDAYAVAPEGAAYELAKFFDTHTAGEIRAALDAYAAMVPLDAASGDLFGGSFYDPAEALGRAIGVDPARLDDNGRHAEVVKGRLAQAAMRQSAAPAGAAENFGWEPGREPTAENVLAWAKENGAEARRYAKEMRRVVWPEATGNVGAMTPEEREALARRLLAEKYVYMGGVRVSLAKAADFVGKDGKLDAKTWREFQAMRALANAGYNAFLFREKYNRHQNGYYRNADGIIRFDREGRVDVRFVDVKHPEALGAIHDAMEKSMDQGDGAVVVYAGPEGIERVAQEVSGAMQDLVPAGRHFAFVTKAGKEGAEERFVGVRKYDGGAIADAATTWLSAHRYFGTWPAQPTDNITPKNGLSSENPGGALYQGAGAPWFQKFLVSDMATLDALYQSIGEQGAARLDALEAKASEGGRRLEALRTAREMEEAGKDAKAIRLATGWEKGKDGKWRWEIMDGEFKADLKGSGGGKLADLYDAPELFAAYPQLRDLRVDVRDDMPPHLGGHYDTASGTITLNANKGEETLRSAVIHEAQHAIQFMEGFAKGGNNEALGRQAREGATGRLVAKARQAALAAARNAIKEFDEHGFSEWARKEHGDLLEQMDGAAAVGLMREWLDAAGRDLPGAERERLQALAQGVEDVVWRENVADNPVALEARRDGEKREMDALYARMNADLGLDAKREEYVQNGGNADDFMLFEQDKLMETHPLFAEYAARRANYHDYNQMARDANRELSAPLVEVDGKRMEPYEAYRRLAGETEARNASARMGMTPEERRATLLAETEDVAREDQIVMLDGQSAMMAMEENRQAESDFAMLGEGLKSGKDGSVTREGLGEVRVPVGEFGPSGYGLKHIIEHRAAQGWSVDQITAIAQMALEAIRTGEQREGRNGRLEFVKNGVTAVVARDARGRWLLTGFAQEKEAAGPIVAVIAENRYAPSYVEFRNEVGAAMASKGYKVSETTDFVKRQNPARLPSGVNGWSTFKDGEHLIHVAKTGDKSTMVHELSHVWLRELEAAAERGALTEEGAALWEDIKTHLAAYQKEGEGEDVGGVFSRSAHERFAREFEAYLFEGKEPRPGLRRAFAAFRQWMLEIYKNVRALIGADALDPEARAIFDRMLDAGEDADEALEYYHAKEELADLYAASEEEKQEARRLRQEAERVTLDQLIERARKNLARLRGSAADRRAAAEQEAREMRPYKALDYVVENGGLNAGEIRQIAGKERLKLIQRHGKKTAVKGGKLPAGFVADKFGWGSIEEMVIELTGAPTFAEKVKQIERRMEAEDEAAIKKEVEGELERPGDDAFHNEERLKEILFHYAALLKRNHGAALPAPKLAEIIRDAAEDIILRETKMTPRHYYKFARAEAAASRQAVAALKRGDNAEVEKQLKLQAINHALSMKAMEYGRQAQEFAKEMRARELTKRLDGVKREYREAVLDIAWKLKTHGDERLMPAKYNAAQAAALIPGGGSLAGVGAGDGRSDISDKSDGSDDSLGDYAPSALELVPEWLRGDAADLPAGYKRLTDLTVADILAAKGAVEALIREGKGMLAGKQLEHAKTIGEIFDDFYERVQKMPLFKASDDGTLRGKAERALNGLWADMKGMLHFAREIGGSFQELVERAHAADVENVLKIKTLRDKLQKPFAVLREEAKKRPATFAIPGVDPRDFSGEHGWTAWDAEKLYAFALNMGTEKNRYALAAGLKLDEAQAYAVAGQLTAREWGAIQEIWDVIGTLAPELDAAVRAISDQAMTREPPLPLTIVAAGGEVVELRGGYYPLKYDTVLSERAETNSVAEEVREALAGTGRGGRGARVEAGMTKARAAGKDLRAVVRLAPRLSLSVLEEHLRDATRFVTHAALIADLNQLFRYRKTETLTIDGETQEVEVANFADAFKDHFGSQMLAALKGWAAYVAHPARQNHGKWDKWFDWMRSRTTIFYLMYKMVTGLKQLIAVFPALNAMREAGGKGNLTRFFGAAMDLMRGGRATIDFVNQKSAFLRARDASGIDREMADTLAALKPYGGKSLKVGEREVTKRDVAEWGAWFMTTADKAVNYPAWLATYRAALDDPGAFGIAGKAGEELDAAAVKAADAVIAAAQPDVLPSALSGMQRAEGAVRLFTMFGSYTMGPLYNRMAGHWHAWRQGRQSGGDLARFVALEIYLPELACAVCYSLWKGALADDDRDVWERLAQGVKNGLIDGTLAMASPFPIVRDLVRGSAPEVPFVSPGYREAKRAWKGLSNGEFANSLWHVTKLAELAAGVPLTNLFEQSARYWDDLSREDKKGRRR